LNKKNSIVYSIFPYQNLSIKMLCATESLISKAK